jgi:GNAT superfamily N-acetyltransferase
VNVAQSVDVSDELRELWRHARKRMEGHRGGAELLLTIGGAVAADYVLDDLVRGGYVWTVDDDTHVVGFAVVRHHVVEGIFIDHDSRRQRVATTFLTALVASVAAPKDGYALPGDRGMKSLYESFGWKARLLTMRGE